MDSFQRKRVQKLDSMSEETHLDSTTEPGQLFEKKECVELVREEPCAAHMPFDAGVEQACSGKVEYVVNDSAQRPMDATTNIGMQEGLSLSVNQELVNTRGLVRDSQVHLANERCLQSCSSQVPLTVPTVVHVSRPVEVEEKRKDLPIVMMEQEIMEAINYNPTVIICGETGCGKTTQVPQFLYEAGFGSSKSVLRKGIIGVTQPRRVAVLATARRVAFELGVRLGKEVGFQVRHDKMIGESSSIKFMTDGILLREVQNDFLLRRYSVIILDEAHERSLNTDILIGMLSRVIGIRQKLFENQQSMVKSGKLGPKNLIPPLKLVLMSATMRVEDFVSGRRLFPEPPPVIEVPTRQFPVTVHFSKRTEIVDYVGQAFKKVMSIHKRLPQGGILVFLTGQREVEYLCTKLRKASKDLISRNSKGKLEDDSSAVCEKSDIEGVDMADIDDAYGNNHQVDRFDSYDEDFGDRDEYESNSSDSGTESDLEFDEDVEELGDKTMDGLLGCDDSLASLKAAFQALSGKTDNGKESGMTDVVLPSDSSLNQTPSKTGKKSERETDASIGALCVLPLYAMLPAAAQLSVFGNVKDGERLVVVATNVAETSLTIPGIKYVVDSGRAKVKNCNPSNGIESYEVQWISKASAAQRAGRAGRTGPGHAYRLYSSAVFNNIFPDFATAEISKVPVDGVILLLKSMNIDKVANFPFPTPPDVQAMIEAERCLKVLEALDYEGKLTGLGRAMSHYPMSPRHSRMLLTVIQLMQQVKQYKRANIILGYAVASAAALSLSNPFIIQFEGGQGDSDNMMLNENSQDIDTIKSSDRQEKPKKKKLKESVKAARAKFANPSSDALTVAYALQCFDNSENPAQFCVDNALHHKTMEEMSKLRMQLLKLVFQHNIVRDSEEKYKWTFGSIDEVESDWKNTKDKCPLNLNEEELLCQALCAGWADRVAKRTRGTFGSSEENRKANAVQYQAAMVADPVFIHRWSSVSRSGPEYVVYNEMLHTKRSYMHGVTAIKPDWLVKYAGSLCTFSAPLADPKPYYNPVTDQGLCYSIPTFGPHLWQLPMHSLLIKDDVQRVAVFAYALLDGQVLPCIKAVQEHLSASPSIILMPEARGQKRVGNLLNELRLKKKHVDSCAMLIELWKENPRKLYSEILDWLKTNYHQHFEELWSLMQKEVQLEPQERFSKKLKRRKTKNSLLT
ncbi:hypothetical protein QQ045_032811 [Rhodiola kirilowii]